MVEQKILLTVRSEQGVNEEVAGFVENVLLNDETVSWCDWRTVSESEVEETYPEEAEENEEDFEELTDKELQRQDYVDNAIHYNLGREFYPYLTRKELQ